jgi:hypothetical protein
MNLRIEDGVFSEQAITIQPNEPITNGRNLIDIPANGPCVDWASGATGAGV